MNGPEILDYVDASEVLTPDQQRRALCLALAVELLAGYGATWANLLTVAKWIDGYDS